MIFLWIISLIIFALICWRQMSWGISLIALFVPSYLLRTTIFGIPTTFLELLIYTTAIVFFLKLLIKKEKIQFKSNLILPIALFLIAAVISVFISPDKVTSLGVLKGWILDPIILYFLIVNGIKKKKEIFLIFSALGISAVFLSTIGIYQFFTKNLLSDGRTGALFESANYLSMFLGPILCFALGLLLLSEEKNQRILFGIISMISLTAVFLTKSYGAFLGILAAFLFLMIAGKKERKKKWFFYAVFLVIAVMILLQVFTPKFAELFNIASKTSMSSRIEIWKASALMIKEHSILGTGLGTFGEVYKQYIPRVVWPPQEWAAPQPHNIYLAFWLNMGILGLISFIWIVIEFFRLKASHSLLIVRYSLISAMICILVHGLVDTPYWKNDLACLFWIIVGMMVAISKIKTAEESNIPKTK